MAEAVALGSEHKRLERDHGTLKDALHSAREEIAKQKGLYCKLEEEHRALMATSDAQKEIIRQNDAALAQKEEEIRSLNKACDQWAWGKQKAEGEKQDAFNLLYELQHSPSWRITAPLRKIKHGIKAVIDKLRVWRYGRRSEKCRRKFLAKFDGCTLIFDHNLGGGANDYRNKMMERLASEGTPSVCIYNNLWFYEPRDFSVLLYSPGEPKEEWHFADWDKCREFISKLSFTRIVYNNLVYNNEAASILKWIATAKCQLLVLVHDFHCICQFFDMITPEGKYCAGEVSCDECISKRTDLRPVFNNPLPSKEWHNIWRDVFAKANEVRVFSPFAPALLEKFYPGVSKVVKCVPHDMDGLRLRKANLCAGDGLNIGVVGSIYGKSKGSEIVAGLASAVAPRKIVVVGTCSGVPEGDNLEITGPYDRNNLPAILEKHGINVVLFPSICPETFSYTVSELIMMDVPVIAFNIGAQGDKVGRYDKGMLIPTVSIEEVVKTANKLYHNIYEKGDQK